MTFPIEKAQCFHLHIKFIVSLPFKVPHDLITYFANLIFKQFPMIHTPIT